MWLKAACVKIWKKAGRLSARKFQEGMKRWICRGIARLGYGMQRRTMYSFTDRRACLAAARMQSSSSLESRIDRLRVRGCRGSADRGGTCAVA